MIKTDSKTGYVIVFSDNTLFSDKIYNSEKRALSVIKAEIAYSEGNIKHYELNKMFEGLESVKEYITQLKGLKVLKVNREISYKVLG